ncbi:hypothetical protein ACFE04_001832 [Oxalis oulophora]
MIYQKPSRVKINKDSENQHSPLSTPPPSLPQQHHHQHQPSVYNIHKNDFREVVQRLIGRKARVSRGSGIPHLRILPTVLLIDAESPVSTYMHFVQNDSSEVLGFANSTPQ